MAPSRVASAVADDVLLARDRSCSAFAYNRGSLHPELTASATEREAGEMQRAAAGEHAPVNLTCELGMTRAIGKPYRHINQLVDEATAATKRRA